jgi:hypothetical protein
MMPIGLMLVNRALQHGFEDLVDHLYLAIGLRVVWGVIVAREAIHKAQGLVAGIVIDNLFDERHWEVVFGTSMIEITKVSADTNNTLFVFDKDKVGNP